MRKAGILAIAVVAALMMVVPISSVNTDAVDSWDSTSSAFSVDGKNVNSGLYESLTNNYGVHMGLYVIDKTGFNFLANEGKSCIGVISNVENSHISDGIVKSIDNKWEVVTENYKALRSDLSISVTIYNSGAAGSLINNLYTVDDRGFSELRSYLGLTDVSSFKDKDIFSLECHFESYIMEKTTTYYRQTAAGDYYPTKVIVETTEVLRVSDGTFSYTPETTKETTSVGCTIDLTGYTRTITDYDYGGVKPVSGTRYESSIYTSSVNDGTADYVFSDSTHTAVMTNPTSTDKVDGSCVVSTYSEITSYVNNSGPSDLYPNTVKPELYIDSIKGVIVHDTTPEVEKDIENLEKEFGLLQEDKDKSYLKTVAYAVAIVLVIIALIVVYFKVFRNRA